MQKLLCPFCDEPLRINKNNPNIRMCMRHKIQYDTEKHTCSIDAIDSSCKYIKDSFTLLNKWHSDPPVVSFAKAELFTPEFNKEDVVSFTSQEALNTDLETKFHWLESDDSYKLIQLNHNVSYQLWNYMTAMVGSAGFAEAAFDITRRSAAEFLYYTMIAYNLVASDATINQYNKVVWDACAIVPDLMFYRSAVYPALPHDKRNAYLLYACQSLRCPIKNATADQFMKWNVETMKAAMKQFDETKPCNTREYLEKKYPLLYSDFFKSQDRLQIAKCDDTIFMYSMCESELCGYNFLVDEPAVVLPNITDVALKHNFRLVMNQIAFKQLLHTKCLKELALALYLVHEEIMPYDGTLDSRIKNFWKHTVINRPYMLG